MITTPRRQSPRADKVVILALLLVAASASLLAPYDPYTANYGAQFARPSLEHWFWILIFPGIAISLGVFGFNLFGDSLRDALDPKLRKG